MRATLSLVLLCIIGCGDATEPTPEQHPLVDAGSEAEAEAAAVYPHGLGVPCASDADCSELWAEIAEAYDQPAYRPLIQCRKARCGFDCTSQGAYSNSEWPKTCAAMGGICGQPFNGWTVCEPK